MGEGSAFEREAAEIPALAARQASLLGPRLDALIEHLDRRDPRLFATIARGSSANAAAFAAYAVALRLGLPTADVPPSIASVYGGRLRLDGALALCVSQSGASPDLASAARAAREGGAWCLGLVNEPGSDLARTIDFELPIGAGPERAIAATKTFVLSVTALLRFIAAWARDETLRAALDGFSSTLSQAASMDSPAVLRMLADARYVFVVGRGPAFPIARELALKLQEVPGLHARAYSAAELLHGPISLATGATPAIVFAGDARSRDSVDGAIARLRAAGAPVILLTPDTGVDTDVVVVRTPAALHEWLQPVASLQALYPLLAGLARTRGRDPDRPPHLAKLTLTR